MNYSKLSENELAAILQDTKRELARRTLAAQADSAKIIKGHEMAKRATLIAVAGGHSILYMGGPGVGKSMLRGLALELGLEATFEARPCPCGNRNDPISPCNCTVAKIEKHIAKWPVADIFIETPRVPFRELDSRPGTSADDMRRMLADAGPRPVNTFHELAHTLLKHATNELGLTAAQVATTVAIAGTIASLERATRIESTHVAEAVNYRFPTYAKL
jgi:predicted ATPase with chaperone activity